MSTFKEKTTKYSSFVNNKNRKKQANVQDTVDLCHQKMMTNFNNNHSSVDKWTQRIEKYKQEIEKINKRQANIEKGLDRILSKMSLQSYMEKVPADVRVTDAENVASFKSQLAVLQSLHESV